MAAVNQKSRITSIRQLSFEDLETALSIQALQCVTSNLKVNRINEKSQRVPENGRGHVDISVGDHIPQMIYHFMFNALA